MKQKGATFPQIIDPALALIAKAESIFKRDLFTD